MRSRVWRIGLAATLIWLGGGSARGADETVNYRVTLAHDNALADSSLRPPLRPRWQIAIGFTQSNLIVAGGRVFFVNDDLVKAELTALDAAPAGSSGAAPPGRVTPAAGRWRMRTAGSSCHA